MRKQKIHLQETGNFHLEHIFPSYIPKKEHLKKRQRFEQQGCFPVVVIASVCWNESQLKDHHSEFLKEKFDLVPMLDPRPRPHGQVWSHHGQYCQPLDPRCLAEEVTSLISPNTHEGGEAVHIDCGSRDF